MLDEFYFLIVLMTYPSLSKPDLINKLISSKNKDVTKDDIELPDFKRA